MSSHQLINYIKESLKNGVTKEDIKKALKDAGWQDTDIENGFNSLNSEESTENVKNKEAEAQTFEDLNQEDPKKEAINYIKESLKSGATQEEIRTNLKNAGWQENDVENALREANASVLLFGKGDETQKEEVFKTEERPKESVGEMLVEEEKPRKKINLKLVGVVAGSLLLIFGVVFAYFFAIKPSRSPEARIINRLSNMKDLSSMGIDYFIEIDFALESTSNENASFLGDINLGFDIDFERGEFRFSPKTNLDISYEDEEGHFGADFELSGSLSYIEENLYARVDDFKLNSLNGSFGIDYIDTEEVNRFAGEFVRKDVLIYENLKSEMENLFLEIQQEVPLSGDYSDTQRIFTDFDFGEVDEILSILLKDGAFRVVHSQDAELNGKRAEKHTVKIDMEIFLFNLIELFDEYERRYSLEEDIVRGVREIREEIERTMSELESVYGADGAFEIEYIIWIDDEYILKIEIPMTENVDRLKKEIEKEIRGEIEKFEVDVKAAIIFRDFNTINLEKPQTPLSMDDAQRLIEEKMLEYADLFSIENRIIEKTITEGVEMGESYYNESEEKSYENFSQDERWLSISGNFPYCSMALLPTDRSGYQVEATKESLAIWAPLCFSSFEERYEENLLLMNEQENEDEEEKEEEREKQVRYFCADNTGNYGEFVGTPSGGASCSEIFEEKRSSGFVPTLNLSIAGRRNNVLRGPNILDFLRFNFLR